MVYIGPDGRVAERRSPWRFSIITDFFRAIYDFLELFLSALINPPQLDSTASTAGGGSVSLHPSSFILLVTGLNWTHLTMDCMAHLTFVSLSLYLALLNFFD